MAQTVQEIQEEERKRDLADIKKLLDTGEGRRQFSRFLDLCHVFHTSFANDALLTVFKEGERNIGLMLLNDITEADPKKYQVMMLESKDRRSQRAKREQDAIKAKNEGVDYER